MQLNFDNVELKPKAMEFQDEFYKRSVLQKSMVSAITDCIEQKILCDDPVYGSISSSFEGLLLMLLKDRYESFRRLIQAMLKANRMLKGNRLVEARLSMKNSHSFPLYNLKPAYRNIKNLLTGLIVTSSIIGYEELSKRQKDWAEYFGTEIQDCEKLTDDQRIYREFVKVRSFDELINFNHFFKEYIQKLIFEFVDDLIQRMEYTNEYFREYEFYLAEYEEENQRLTKTISDINSARKQLRF